MVGEVGLADDEQAGHLAHQIVIHPQAAHRVVRRGINAHRHLVGVFAGDVVIHVEQVAVALADGAFAQPADGVGEVEIDAASALADAAALVAHFLGRPRGDVARGEVAEAGILAFQIIIALVLGDLVGRPAGRRRPWAPRCGRRCAAIPT